MNHRVVSEAIIVSQATILSHTIILSQAIPTLLSHAQTYWKPGREQFAKQSNRLSSLKAPGKGGNKGSRGRTPQSPDPHHFQSPTIYHTAPELDVPDLQDDAPQFRVCLCVCLCVCFCVWVWVCSCPCLACPSLSLLLSLILILSHSISLSLAFSLSASLCCSCPYLQDAYECEHRYAS